jgi:hypothetical protein
VRFHQKKPAETFDELTSSQMHKVSSALGTLPNPMLLITFGWSGPDIAGRQGTEAGTRDVTQNPSNEFFRDAQTS